MAFDPFGLLSSVVGGGLGFLVGGPLGAAVGSGLGTTAYTGDLGRGIASGLLSYGLGSAVEGLAGFGSSGVEAAAGGAGAAPGTIMYPANDPAIGNLIARHASESVPQAALNSPASLLDKIGTKATGYFDKLGEAGSNLTNPDALKHTFMDNALKTTVPIGLGIYGGAMDMSTPGGSQSAPTSSGSMYYPFPGNRPSGRRYYGAGEPDPYGRENTYFGYSDGGEVELSIDEKDRLRRIIDTKNARVIDQAKARREADAYDERKKERGMYGGVQSRDPFDGRPPSLTRFMGGGPVSGPGGGLDDAIPAIVNGRQPAALSSGEYVVPAHAVSALGNGSTEEGVRQLDGMVDRTMKSKYGTTHRKPSPIKPAKMMPA